MKIKIEDFDLIITSEKGLVRIYENGKEMYGVQSLEYTAKCGELPSLIIEKTTTDNQGNFYLIGGGKTGKREKENV